MNKLLFMFSIFLILFSLSGCNYSCSEKNTTSQNIGKIISVKEISTSWNDTRRMLVITDKGTFYVRGIHSVLYGTPLFLISCSNWKLKYIKYLDEKWKVY